MSLSPARLFSYSPAYNVPDSKSSLEKDTDRDLQFVFLCSIARENSRATPTKREYAQELSPVFSSVTETFSSAAGFIGLGG